jgi:hypothetical protein
MTNVPRYVPLSCDSGDDAECFVKRRPVGSVCFCTKHGFFTISVTNTGNRVTAHYTDLLGYWPKNDTHTVWVYDPVKRKTCTLDSSGVDGIILVVSLQQFYKQASGGRELRKFDEGQSTCSVAEVASIVRSIAETAAITREIARGARELSRVPEQHTDRVPNIERICMFVVYCLLIGVIFWLSINRR